jgi:hypothetical protein
MLERVKTEPLLTDDWACASEASDAGTEALRRENRRLKNLLITVATIVLKSIVEANNRDGGNPSPLECACLFEKAEECFLAARSNVGHGVAESLEAAGRALLARAVELKNIDAP